MILILYLKKRDGEHLGCTISRKKNHHNLNSNIYAIAFLYDGDSLARISQSAAIVDLFTSQQSQMLYQSHSQRVKQNIRLIQHAGQRLPNDSTVQLHGAEAAFYVWKKK